MFCLLAGNLHSLSVGGGVQGADGVEIDRKSVV